MIPSEHGGGQHGRALAADSPLIATAMADIRDVRGVSPRATTQQVGRQHCPPSRLAAYPIPYSPSAPSASGWSDCRWPAPNYLFPQFWIHAWPARMRHSWSHGNPAFPRTYNEWERYDVEDVSLQARCSSYRRGGDPLSTGENGLW